MKKRIVISAINIIDGGAKTILRQVIDSISDNQFNYLEFHLFLANEMVLADDLTVFDRPNFHIRFFPKSKRSWLIRCFYEYVYFYFVSLCLRPDVWLSLHDVTPNVKCRNRFVYCHNPSVFVDVPLKDFFKDKKQFIFSLVYGLFYKINIRKNKNVIVQQQWMATEFERMFDIANVIVARPLEKTDDQISSCSSSNLCVGALKDKYKISTNGKKILFYPAFPRYFKNHKLLFETGLLTYEKIDFHMTINENECGFIDSMLKLSKNNRRLGLKFIGKLSRDEVDSYYRISDALVFPSLIETWGLPISEYKRFNKPIFAPDLPYAHETVGAYNNVYWFSPLSANSLSDAINRWQQTGIPDGTKKYTCSHKTLDSWSELIEHIVK